MRGFGLQRQRPVADQLRIAAVLLRKIGRWMPQYAKAFTSRFWVFPNERQIKIQEKGIIKFSNRLRGKKTDVLNDLLTVDSNQLLSVNLFWQLNYTIWSWLLL